MNYIISDVFDMGYSTHKSSSWCIPCTTQYNGINVLFLHILFVQFLLQLQVRVTWLFDSHVI